MCLGNTTTSPSATSNVYWRRPEEWTTPGEDMATDITEGATGSAKKSALKAPSKSAQSSKTTGGTY